MTSTVSAVEAKTCAAHIEEALHNARGLLRALTGADDDIANAVIAEIDKAMSESLPALARKAEALERDNADLREALKPFVSSFEARRYAYSKRYSDRDLGYANFDKMPDGWAMEHISFNMGVFRRARALLGGSDAE